MPRNAFKPVHGHAARTGRSPTYRAWESMMGRCYRPTAGGYRFYGARGIAVCYRWRIFENFLADMGERPDGMSLDRADPEKDYGPENCRWETLRTQNRNRRSAHLLTINGRTQCLMAWCEEYGARYASVLWRLKKGWDAELALKHPISKRRAQ